MKTKIDKSLVKFDSQDNTDTQGIFEGVLKFDAKQPKFNHLGHLIVTAYVAKVGVISRFDATTGKTINEFIPESSLFSEESKNTMKNIPVVRFHAVENGKRSLLTSKNTTIHQKGISLGEPQKVKFDGQDGEEIYMAIDLMIQDESTIQDVLNDVTPEISMGYTVVKPDIKQTGEFKNIKYDSVQQPRINNHISLEKKGFNRSGMDVRVKFDSKDGEIQFNYKESPEDTNKNQNGKDILNKKEYFKMDIDGLDVDVKDISSEKIIRKALETRDNQVKDWKIKFDAKEQEVANLKTEIESKKTEIAKFDSKEKDFVLIAKERIKLEDTAVSILGKDLNESEKKALSVKFDSMDDNSLRKEIILAIEPGVKFDSMDEKEIKGYLTGSLKFHASEQVKYDAQDHNISKLRGIIPNIPNNANQTESKKKAESLFSKLEKRA